MCKQANQNFVTPWEWRVWLVVVGVAAAAIRLVYFLIVGKDRLTWGDEIVYDQLARNILAHGCFCFEPGMPTVWRAPMYALLLSVIYGVNASFASVVLIQAIAGGLSSSILAAIGRRISNSMTVGVVAALIFTVNPVLIFASNLLYAETLYILVLLLFVYVCMRIIDSASHWVIYSIIAGVLLGLSLLLRPTLLLFPVCMAIWAYAVFQRFVRATVVTALITLATLVTVGPWTARNFIITGAFIPISANSGLNLHQGNHPNADGAALPFERVDPLPGLTEKARDDVYLGWGIQWIRENPLAFLQLAPLKLYKFLSFLETSNQGQVYSRVAGIVLAATVLYYAFALAGFCCSIPRWRIWFLPYFLIGHPALMAVVFYGGTRYGMVVQPFVFLLIALFTHVMLQVFMRKGMKLPPAISDKVVGSKPK